MKTLAIIIVSVFVVSCLKFSDKPESYGISLVEITMEPEELGRLNSEITAKRPVPATVKIGATPYDAKVNYAGQSTLHYIKKSYDINFTNRKYQGGRDYRLSSQATDKTALRSVIGFYAFEVAGILSPKIEPVYLYVNRRPQGLYYLFENITVDYYRNHSIQVESLYKAKLGNARFDSKNLSNPKTGFRDRSDTGTMTDLRHLIEYANQLPSNENLKRISELLDIDNALTYWAVSTYLNNWDGLRNNFFLYRVENGKFHFSPWDLDRIFENAPAGEENYRVGKSPFEGNVLKEHLLGYPEVRDRYLQILRTYFNETLPTEALIAEIRKHEALIREAYQNDRVLSAKGQTLEKVSANLIDAVKSWHQALKDDVISK